MLGPHPWAHCFDCSLDFLFVCPYAAGESSTDIPDSAVEIPDCHDWLDEDVRAHSSQATGTRQASVPAVKVVPNGRGDPPDVGKDSGKRRHSEGRHRHKSPALCSPTGNHSGASGDDTGGEVPNRHRSRTSDPRDAYSGRRRHSEGGEGAHGKRVNDRRDVSFGPASDPASLSSRPPRRQQTDEASLVVRSAPLLIENNKVVLVRAQLAEHGIAGVDDAAIAKELEAQGGHVGRTVNRLKNRPVALPAAISSRRSASEQTAAEIAANVARTAAVAGGAQQRRHDEAALRYYTKAFKAEHGRHAAAPPPASHLGIKGPALLRRVPLSQVSCRGTFGCTGLPAPRKTGSQWRVREPG
jgi:hypothetical protein